MRKTMSTCTWQIGQHLPIAEMQLPGNLLRPLTGVNNQLTGVGVTVNESSLTSAAEVASTQQDLQSLRSTFAF